jgi:predicted MPP superfamily phosphohydrolase
MARLREALKGPVYGVLGNHDTIRMVPDLEGMGIRMLLNECVVTERGGHRIHLAGIDDAHFFRVDNIEKAADSVPHEDFSILLSHTPEIYRQAAHAGFDLLLSSNRCVFVVSSHAGIVLKLPASASVLTGDAKPWVWVVQW